MLNPFDFDILFSGTWSEGTHNEQHIIPRLQEALGWLHKKNACGTIDDDEILASVQPCDYSKGLCDILLDRLDLIGAEYGYYFGAHPDDGADFGFWRIER